MATGDEASRKMHDYLLAKQRRKEDYWLRKYGKVLSSPSPHDTEPKRDYRDEHPVPVAPTSLPPIKPRRRPPGKMPMFKAAGELSTFPSKGSRLPERQHRTNDKLPAIKRSDKEHEADEAHASSQQSLARGSGPAVMGQPADPAAAAAAARAGAVRDLEMELNVLKAIKAREDVLDRLRVACDKLDISFGGGAPLVLSQVDPLVRLFYRLVSNLRQRTLDTIEAIGSWHRKTGSATPFVYYGTDYLSRVGPDLGFLDGLVFLSSRLVSRRAADDPFLMEVTPDGVPIEEATAMDLRRGGHRVSSDALRIRMARKTLGQYGGPQHRAHAAPTQAATAATADAPDDDDDEGAVAAALAEAQRREASVMPFLPEVTQYGSARGDDEPDDAMLEAAAAARARASVASLKSQDSRQESAQRAEAGRPGGEEEAERDAVESKDPDAAVEEAVRAEPDAAVEEAERAEPDAAVEEEEDEEEEKEESNVKSSDDTCAQQQPAVRQEHDNGAEEAADAASATAPAVNALAVVASAAEDDDVVLCAEPSALEGQEQHPCTAGSAPARAEAVPASKDLNEGDGGDQAAEADVAAGAPPPAFIAADEDVAAEALMRSMLVDAEDELDLDDSHFLDHALDAMIASLEPAHLERVAPGTFTVAGWEIDRTLDCMVLGIAEETDIDDLLEDSLLGSLEQPLGAREASTGRHGYRGRADVLLVDDDMCTYHSDGDGDGTWGGGAGGQDAATPPGRSELQALPADGEPGAAVLILDEEPHHPHGTEGSYAPRARPLGEEFELVAMPSGHAVAAF